jgi:hypothetical protein
MTNTTDPAAAYEQGWLDDRMLRMPFFANGHWLNTDQDYVNFVRDHVPALISERAAMQARIAALEGENVLTGMLPPNAGIVAYDRDECTVTIALDCEADVLALRDVLPLRKRVKLCDDGGSDERR